MGNMRKVDDSIFGRMNENGDVDILDVDDGEAICRLDANVYPVGNDLSVRYEYSNGIVLSLADANLLGIKIEL